MSDYVDITNEKIAVEEIGEPWLSLESIMIPEQAQIFNTSYNLIILAVKECSLSLDITDSLNNPNLELPNLIAEVRETLLIYLIDTLVHLGITIDKDVIDSDSLPYLNVILSLIYDLDGSEDPMGLYYILENQTFTNKDRYIELIKRVYDLEDESPYDEIIADVSSDVIKGLMTSLTNEDPDDSEYINNEIASRIKANKDFIAGSIAETHVKDGGTIGLSHEAITNFYVNELSGFITDIVRYYKEVLCLLIISSLTDQEIEDGFSGMIKDTVTDMNELYSVSVLLEQVVLK